MKGDEAIVLAVLRAEQIRQRHLIVKRGRNALRCSRRWSGDYDHEHVPGTKQASPCWKTWKARDHGGHRLPREDWCRSCNARQLLHEDLKGLSAMLAGRKAAVTRLARNRLVKLNLGRKT